jgi:hypothetical protein
MVVSDRRHVWWTAPQRCSDTGWAIWLERERQNDDPGPHAAPPKRSEASAGVCLMPYRITLDMADFVRHVPGFPVSRFRSPVSRAPPNSTAARETTGEGVFQWGGVHSGPPENQSFHSVRIPAMFHTLCEYQRQGEHRFLLIYPSRVRFRSAFC